ncbi:MAG: hypothetical protein V1848_00445 [Candidatus Magasanikbacteria bacterium]
MDTRNENKELRSEFRRWWFYIIGLIVIATVVFGVIRYVGVFTSTVVEREVFENSYQYSEARKAEIVTYEAQLAELRSQLSNPNMNDGDRANIEAQISAINVRLNVAKRRSN